MINSIILENAYEAYMAAKFSLYFIWLPMSALMMISGILNIFDAIKNKRKQKIGEVIILTILAFLLFGFFVYFAITMF